MVNSLPAVFIASFILNANILLAQKTYFIDSNNGNDNNDGLTEISSLKSHTSVESIDLQPGDVVKFARGSAWIFSMSPQPRYRSQQLDYSDYFSLGSMSWARIFSLFSSPSKIANR